MNLSFSIKLILIGLTVLEPAVAASQIGPATRTATTAVDPYRVVSVLPADAKGALVIRPGRERAPLRDNDRLNEGDVVRVEESGTKTTVIDMRNGDRFTVYYDGGVTEFRLGLDRPCALLHGSVEFSIAPRALREFTCHVGEGEREVKLLVPGTLFHAIAQVEKTEVRVSEGKVEMRSLDDKQRCQLKTNELGRIMRGPWECALPIVGSAAPPPGTTFADIALWVGIGIAVGVGASIGTYEILKDDPAQSCPVGGCIDVTIRRLK